MPIHDGAESGNLFPMDLDSEAAVAAVEAAHGPPDRGASYQASPVPGTSLYSVATVGADGMPYAGSAVYVGPDRRVWSFSSNPGIHDHEFTVRALMRLYEHGIAAAVDERMLAQRVEAITASRRDELDAVLRDAKAGRLRQVPKQPLP